MQEILQTPSGTNKTALDKMILKFLSEGLKQMSICIAEYLQFENKDEEMIRKIACTMDCNDFLFYNLETKDIVFVEHDGLNEKGYINKYDIIRKKWH